MGGVSGNSNFAMMSGSKSNSSNDSLIRIPKVGMTLGFLPKSSTYRGLKIVSYTGLFGLAAILVANCRASFFSSKAKRELIRLNTKTICRRGSKGSKTKPQILILNRIQQRDIRFTCCSVDKTSIV